MIQKTDISVLNVDSRSLSYVVVIQNLEGERDYGQLTLATCTFLKQHIRRGVVTMVVVFVAVQKCELMVFCKSNTKRAFNAH